jgi:hypothetical protein
MTISILWEILCHSIQMAFSTYAQAGIYSYASLLSQIYTCFSPKTYSTWGPLNQWFSVFSLLDTYDWWCLLTRHIPLGNMKLCTIPKGAVLTSERIVGSR